MIFGRQRDLRQTCIDLAKPDASVFEYTSMMFAGFLFRPDAKKVCLIGLGGGYIPTVFRMHLPQVRLRTVEVDPVSWRSWRNSTSGSPFPPARRFRSTTAASS